MIKFELCKNFRTRNNYTFHSVLMTPIMFDCTVANGFRADIWNASEVAQIVNDLNCKQISTSVTDKNLVKSIKNAIYEELQRQCDKHNAS